MRLSCAVASAQLLQDLYGDGVLVLAILEYLWMGDMQVPTEEALQMANIVPAGVDVFPPINIVACYGNTMVHSHQPMTPTQWCLRTTIVCLRYRRLHIGDHLRHTLP